MMLFGARRVGVRYASRAEADEGAAWVAVWVAVWMAARGHERLYLVAEA